MTGKTKEGVRHETFSIVNALLPGETVSLEDKLA